MGVIVVAVVFIFSKMCTLVSVAEWLMHLTAV